MEILFWVLSAILLTSAVGVVAFRDPIQSALCLVANLLTVAGFFAMLDAHFLAAVQVIVYAGAIVVLVLFVLMLLNLQEESRQPRHRGLIAAGVLFGGVFAYWFLSLTRTAFEVFRVSGRDIEGTVRAIGLSLYSDYLFPFEAASVLITVAIVGAVMIAQRRA